MKRISTIVLAALAFTSCEKFVDVNTNPNTPTVTKANYVFSNALNNSGRIVSGGLHITGGTWTGYYAHSTSFTGGGQEKTYVFTNNDFNFFDGIYDNMADYQYVIDHAQEDGVAHLIGPSMIMQAMVMQKLVDIYGNVPFTEALKGTAFTEPKYDDAATIYTGLMKMLTDGQAKVSASTFPISDPSDVFFNANKARWMQLANTVKMRLIVRRSNVSGYTPAADLGTITADGVITAPVFCNPGYLKTAGKLNPYYQNYGFNENDAPTGDFRKMNRVVVEWLKGSNDVFRLQRMCSVKGLSENLVVSPNLSDYVAAPLGGDGSSYLSANVSAMGSMQIVKGQATRPLLVMSDAEASFLQAEAIQRGWLTGSAQAKYEEGVRKSFALCANAQNASIATATAAAADAAATSYLRNLTNWCDWSVSTDKLKTIWVQKWVALCNVDGGEAWAEYRRTNSPSNPTGNCPSSPRSVAVSSSAKEPVRFFYPLRESNVNGKNVPAGIDVFTSRVFWDLN